MLILNTLKTPHEAVGKTVKDVVHDYNKILFLFTDDTALVVRGGDEDEVELDVACKFHMPDWSKTLLMQHGLTSQEQLDQWDTEERRRREERIREADLRTYNFLKKKLNLP